MEPEPSSPPPDEPAPAHDATDAPSPEPDQPSVARPKFLRSFPKDPELDLLVEAFERGNYAYIRREAPRVAEHAESKAVRDAARELRRRIDPDPLFKLLILLAFLLLAFLVVWTYGRGP